MNLLFLESSINNTKKYKKLLDEALKKINASLLKNYSENSSKARAYFICLVLDLYAIRVHLKVENIPFPRMMNSLGEQRIIIKRGKKKRVSRTIKIKTLRPLLEFFRHCVCHPEDYEHENPKKLSNRLIPQDRRKGKGGMFVDFGIFPARNEIQYGGAKLYLNDIDTLIEKLENRIHILIEKDIEERIARRSANTAPPT